MNLTRSELDEALRIEVVGMHYCDSCSESIPNGFVGHFSPHLHWPDPLTGEETVVSPSVTFLDADGVLSVLATMRVRGFVSNLKGMPPRAHYYRDNGRGGIEQSPNPTPRWAATFSTPLDQSSPWVDVTEFDDNPALAVGRAAVRAVRERPSPPRDKLAAPATIPDLS